MVKSYEQMDNFADEFRDANVDAAKRMYADSASQFNTSLLSNGLVLLIGITAGIAATIFVSREVSGPIDRITKLMRKLANAEFKVEIPYLDRKNEIGDMAKAVQVFKENGIRVQQIAEQEASFGEKCDELRQDIGEMVKAALEGDFSGV